MKVDRKELNQDNFKELLSPKTKAASELMDILGDIKQELSFLKRVEGFLKEVIASQFDEDEWEFDTDRFHLMRVMRTRMSLDQDSVKEEMGDAWWEDHLRETEYFELRVSALKEE